MAWKWQAASLLYLNAVVAAYFVNSGFYNNPYRIQSYPQQIHYTSFNPFNRQPASTLAQFSLCFYHKLTNSAAGDEIISLFSYLAGDLSSPEIVLEHDFRRKVTWLHIGGETRVQFPLLSGNKWTHVCLSWNGLSGEVNGYYDGAPVATYQSVKLGYRNPANGYLTLGQSQNSFGHLIQLQMWDRVISPAEVKRARLYLLSSNLIAWESTIGQSSNETASNGTSVSKDNSTNPTETPEVEPSQTKCLDLNQAEAPYNQKSGFENMIPKEVVATLKDHSLPEMTEVTYCFYIFNHIPRYRFRAISYENAYHDPMISFGYEERGIFFTMGSDTVFWETEIDRDRDGPQCLTWSGHTGDLTFYYKNFSLTNFTGVSKHYTIPSNGKLKIMQQQYDVADDNNGNLGFVYKFVFFYMWKRVLSEEEMNNFWNCTGSVSDYVVNWEKAEWDVEVQTCLPHSERSPIEKYDFVGVPRAVEGEVKVFDDDPVYDMQEFTVCFWMYSEDKYLTLPTIMYQSGDYDVFTFGFTRNGTLAIMFNERLEQPGNFLQAGSYQHYCFAWSGINNGNVEIYAGGKKEHTAVGLAIGAVIPGKGYFYVKNIQYAPAITESPTAGFKAKVIDFNWWNYSLSQDEVSRAYNCNLVQGNVVNARSSEWYINKCNHWHMDSPFDTKSDVKDFSVIISVQSTLRNLAPIPEMKEFTFSMYASFTAEVPNVFTYEDQRGMPFITFTHKKKALAIRIGDTVVKTRSSYTGWWYYTVRWSSSTGILELFTDDIQREVFRDVSAGFIIPGNGRIILQQIQMKPWDASNPQSAYYVKARDFNLWQSLLTDDQIIQESKCRGTNVGSVVSWDTSEWDVKKYYCTHLNRSSPFDLKEDIAEGVVIIVDGTLKNPEPLPELSEFTYCLYSPFWSMNSLGTPFVYQDENGKAVISLSNSVSGMLFRVGPTVLRVDGTFAGWWLFCFSWSGVTGEVIFTGDGSIREKYHNVSLGYKVPVNGKIILQQAQRKPTDSSKDDSAYLYRATIFNMWTYAINGYKIKEMYDCPGLVEPDLVKWETTDWSITKTTTNSVQNDNPFKRSSMVDRRKLSQATLKPRQPLPQLNDFTYCFVGISPNPATEAVFFSYKNENDETILSLFRARDKILIKVGDQSKTVLYTEWGFISYCATWASANGGTLKVFLNGDLTQTFSDFGSSITIPANGRLILQQEEIPPNMADHFASGLIFTVKGFSIWDRTLSNDEVKEASKGSPSFAGNVVDWRSAEWELTDENVCRQPAKSAYDAEVPNRPNTNEVRLQQYVNWKLTRSMKAYTISFWCKTENPVADMFEPLTYRSTKIAHKDILLDYYYTANTLVVGDYVYKATASTNITTESGKWMHVCVTGSKNTGIVEIYLGGVSVGQIQGQGSKKEFDEGFLFARQLVVDPSADQFLYKITDINMWNRILSSEEIAIISNCSSSLSGNVAAFADMENRYKVVEPSFVDE